MPSSSVVSPTFTLLIPLGYQPPPFLSQLLFTLPEVVPFLSVAHSILNKFLYFIIAGPYFLQHYESCESGYFSSAAVQVGSANLQVI